MGDILECRQGEIITLPAVVTDKDNTQVDPSVSQRIRVADPTRTLVVLTGSATVDAMETDGATGEWKYDYQTAADAAVGKWAYQCEMKDGADNHIAYGEGEFWVREAFPAELT